MNRQEPAGIQALDLDSSAVRQRLTAEGTGLSESGMTGEEAGLAAADAAGRLCRGLRLPVTLREVGVPEEGLEFTAAAALHGRSLSANPKPITDAGPMRRIPCSVSATG